MTQDIEKYVEQALEQSRLPDIDAVHGCLHCESFDYPKLVADMCTTITKVAEEARREERERWVQRLPENTISVTIEARNGGQILATRKKVSIVSATMSSGVELIETAKLAAKEILANLTN